MKTCIHTKACIWMWIAALFWRRTYQPTPAFLPRESCGQRSLVGCCPQDPHRVGHNWSDLACMHACIGEGNGNPLQCSCLENPRDGGAWWAAICGVAQSWTRLKWLSSSSSSSIHSPPKLETTPLSFGGWMSVLHPYNEIRLSNKNYRDI